MAKKLDFKDFLTVDYAPGMDPLIKRNAKKRKGNDTETSAVGEATAPGGKPLPALNPDQAHKWLDQGKHAKKLNMGWPTKDVIVKQKGANGTHHVHAHQYTEEVEVVTEVLNPQQRRTRALNLRRIQSKISLGRERASRRFADPARLQSRARKEARAFIFKRLSKNVPKEEMTFQRRQDIEKRMDSPAIKKRIDVLATKLLRKVRAAEIQRHQKSGQQAQND